MRCSACSNFDKKYSPPALRSSPPVAPYGGTPASVPGAIQAEFYNNGGIGVGYYDTDDTNNGGVSDTAKLR